MPRVSLPDLTLTEWAVLALITERSSYGFALAKELGPDGDLGRIWTVPRPIVYRTLGRLEQQGLIEPTGVEPGDSGPQRTRLRATRHGKSVVDRWLATPAPHVRELRTRLLLQLRFLDRRGLDMSPLATAQLEQLTPILASLRDRADTTGGFDGLVARWRYETAHAAARVLETIATPRPTVT